MPDEQEQDQFSLAVETRARPTNPPDWALPQSEAYREDDPSEQWFFMFNEHLQLTVQAIHRLHEALAAKMP